MSKARDLASATPAPSTVSSTELGYLDGVTSAIQTQVDSKIPKTLTTTTGDTIYASSANTPARLAVGSTGQVLTVSGGVPTWATPSGGLTLISSTSVSGASSYNVSSVFSSTYTNYKVIIKLSAVANANDDINMKLRASGTNSSAGLYSSRIFSYSPGVGGGLMTTDSAAWFIGLCGSGNPAVPTYNLDIYSPNEATKTTMTGSNLGVNASYYVMNLVSGYADNNTQYDGFNIYASGNFSATIKVYGYGD